MRPRPAIEYIAENASMQTPVQCGWWKVASCAILALVVEGMQRKSRSTSHLVSNTEYGEDSFRRAAIFSLYFMLYYYQYPLRAGAAKSTLAKCSGYPVQLPHHKTPKTPHAHPAPPR